MIPSRKDIHLTTGEGGRKKSKNQKMKKTLLLTGIVVGLVPTVQAAIMVGTVIGLDFESAGQVFPVPATATATTSNFNNFNTNLADGATGTISSVIDTSSDVLPGVGIEITNNLGKTAGLTGVESNATTVAPFNVSSIFSDNWGGANVGNGNRADFGPLTDASNIVIRFTGLDTGFLYDLSGGGAFNNANFNTIWTVAGTAPATTDSTGTAYVTLTDLAPDASGNIEVTVTRNNVQLLISGASLEAVSAVPEPSTALLSALAGLGLLARRRR